MQGDIQITRDRVAERLDELADLFIYWQKNRAKGRTPSAVGASELSALLEADLVAQAQKQIGDWIKDPWKHAEEHRRGISALAWAGMQPKEQSYYIGDVVEFKVGGFGVINEVRKANGGWPPSYSTEPVDGLHDRDDSKRAWHYEGDFKHLVAPSGVRSVMASNAELWGE